MANIVVVSTTNSIKVDFGVYANTLGISKKTWHKSDVHFGLNPSNEYVTVLEFRVPSFAVSFDGSSSTLQIDSINGVAPTSNSDLYDKLIALIA